MPQLDKVSLGAETWVAWERCDDVAALIHQLRSDGVLVVALEQTHTSIDIAQAVCATPLALVVGHEVDGLAPDVLNLCDRTVHIPMRGKKKSMNVSVAAGIAMYVIQSRAGV